MRAHDTEPERDRDIDEPAGGHRRAMAEPVAASRGRRAVGEELAASESTAGSSFFDAVNTGIHDGGAAIPDDLRARFERSLGTDLSDVRVHDGPAAHAAADAVDARAYALGSHIVMGAGQYAPSTNEGAQLLAHEVAHTVQQRGATAQPQFKLRVTEEGDAEERDADTAAAAMMAGSRAAVAPAGPSIARSGNTRGRHQNYDRPPRQGRPVRETGAPADERERMRGRPNPDVWVAVPFDQLSTGQQQAINDEIAREDLPTTGDHPYRPSCERAQPNPEEPDEEPRARLRHASPTAGECIGQPGRVDDQGRIWVPDRLGHTAEGRHFDRQNRDGSGHVNISRASSLGGGGRELFRADHRPARPGATGGPASSAPTSSPTNPSPSTTPTTGPDDDGGNAPGLGGAPPPGHDRRPAAAPVDIDGFHHDGGRWTQNGRPLAAGDHERLREALVRRAQQDSMHPDELRMYREWLANTQNRPVPPGEWRERHLPIMREHAAGWNAQQRNSSPTSPQLHRTSGDNLHDTPPVDPARPSTEPRSRPLGVHPSDHGSYDMPDGNGNRIARVGTGGETIASGNDTCVTGGAASCAITAIHQRGPDGETNRMGHPPAMSAGPQYEHLEASVVQAVRQGGAVRGVVRIDPRAQQRPASQDANHVEPDFHTFPQSHGELLRRLQARLEAAYPGRVSRDGDLIVVRDEHGGIHSTVGIGLVTAPVGPDGAPRVQHATLTRNGTAIGTEGVAAPHTIPHDEAPGVRPHDDGHAGAPDDEGSHAPGMGAPPPPNAQRPSRTAQAPTTVAQQPRTVPQPIAPVAHHDDEPAPTPRAPTTVAPRIVPQPIAPVAHHDDEPAATPRAPRAPTTVAQQPRAVPQPIAPADHAEPAPETHRSYAVGDPQSGMASTTRSTTTQRGNVATTTGTTTGATVSADGVALHRGHSRTTTTTQADGTQHVRGSGATATGGIVDGADGHGVRAGVGGNRTTEVRDADGNVRRGTTTSGNVDAQITDRGAAATASGEHTEQRGPMRYTTQLGATAGFRVDVVRSEEDPGQYDLVTRLHYGATVGGDVGAGRGGTGVSVGGELSGSRSVTYRHRLTRAEVDRYLASARAVASGQAPAADHPEFGFMARLRAAGDHAHGVRETDVVDDPAAAARMAPGSSLETTTTAGATVRGSVTAGTPTVGAGVSGSAGRNQTRTVRVSAIREQGHDYVEIRLEFADGTTGSAGGHARAFGVGIEGSRSTASDQGRIVTVRLDRAAQTYDADFRRVVAVHDLAAAEAVAEHFHAAITRTRNSSTTDTVGVGAAGDRGVIAGVGGSSTQVEGEAVALGARDANGHRSLDVTTTGASTQQGGARIGNTQLVQTSDATTATATTDANHQQVDVNREQRDSIPVLPQSLQDALGTTRRQLEEIRFSDHDVDVLVQRAAHADRWLNALPGGLILHVRSAWNALGNALRNPQPDPTWVAADRRIANRAARGQAITHFIATAPSGDGIDALYVAARESGGERLGRHIEWPESISGRGPVFRQLEVRVNANAARYAGFTGPDRVAQIEADARDIRVQLEATLRAATECTTFRSSTAKVETETAVRELLARNEQIRRAAITQPVATTAGAAQASAPSEQDLRQRLDVIQHQLQTFKSEEMRHWRAAGAQISAAGHWYSNPNTCANNATNELCAIEHTYGPWMDALRECYSTTQALHGDPTTLRRLHPNVEWSIQLLRQARDVAAISIEVDGPANRWRAATRMDR